MKIKHFQVIEMKHQPSCRCGVCGPRIDDHMRQVSIEAELIRAAERHGIGVKPVQWSHISNERTRELEREFRGFPKDPDIIDVEAVEVVEPKALIGDGKDG